MPHKNRVRRQIHVGGAPELLGETEMTFSFGAFPKALAKLFPSRARRLQRVVAPLMEGNKPTGLRRQEPETDRRKSIRLPLPGGDSVTLFSAKSMARSIGGG